MVPAPWVGFFAGLASAFTGRQAVKVPDASTQPPQAWEAAASARRRVLLALTLLSALGAAALLWHARPAGDAPVLRIAQIALYALLFGWVSAGFITAMMGFVVQLRGDKHGLRAADVRHQAISASARTAIIMPICNEQVSAVFANLSATLESLAATGASRLFDLFILSDSSDPAVRAEELAAWAQLRATLGDGGRVHYRWRQRRTRRKAGNVADFCRRWGRDYRYMVVLDADSVMSGDALVTLVRLMEANPTAGIVQTAPAACGLSTLHARSQQFAGRVTGRLFTAGMQYWQLGESHYWGHNAIIRVEPFMKHCALAPLPGKGGLSGDIMSHDFVEAALMRRAGYRVWLVSDLEGSYEQQPPNLLEELRRDRRWCQGNLQNARLIAEPGLHGVHRAMLATGAMAYLSAPLWLAFVMLGAASWFSSGRGALGLDGGLPMEMVALWSSTFAMLMLPRLLGVVALLLNGEAKSYGGGWALLKGAALEGMLSALQAPVRMVAHSIFVVVALTGIKLDWKSPPREAQAVTWKDASGPFAPVFVTVALALAATLALDASLAMWLLPVALPLLLAIPLAVATSKPGLGEFIRDAKVLMIPEETQAPAVLRAAWSLASQPSRPTRLPDVLRNPALFEVVRQSMGSRQTAHGDRGIARLGLLDRVMVEQDLHAMTPRECMWMLSEPQQISRLRDRLASNTAMNASGFARSLH